MPSGVFKRSDEHRANISKATKGKKKSPEHCLKMSLARKGVPVKWKSPEHKAEVMARRKAGMRRGKDHHFFGVGAGPEARKIISATHKGMSYKVCRQNGIDPETYRMEIANGKRWCGSCKSFIVQGDMSGSPNLCKVCSPIKQRAGMIKRAFGVDAAWYEQKLAEQNGACAICKSPEKLSKNGFLSIDHDHADGGSIRGLLCTGCNAMLGRIENDLFIPALRYLAGHNSRVTQMIRIVDHESTAAVV